MGKIKAPVPTIIVSASIMVDSFVRALQFIAAYLPCIQRVCRHIDHLAPMRDVMLTSDPNV